MKPWKGRKKHAQSVSTETFARDSRTWFYSRSAGDGNPEGRRMMEKKDKKGNPGSFKDWVDGRKPWTGGLSSPSLSPQKYLNGQWDLVLGGPVRLLPPSGHSQIFLEICKFMNNCIKSNNIIKRITTSKSNNALSINSTAIIANSASNFSIVFVHLQIIITYLFQIYEPTLRKTI
jgi:hypothetical protein